MTRFVIDMPWALCFAQGFALAAVAPAIVAPSMMILQKADYGVVKGIPTTLLAALSIDNIIAVTVFGIFLSYGLNDATKEPVDVLLAEEPELIDENTADSLRFLVEGDESEPRPIWMEIGFSVIQLIIGLVIACACGVSMICCNVLPKYCSKGLKVVICILMAIFIPVACDLGGIPNTKFVAIVFFGYVSKRKWKEDYPEQALAKFWSSI